MTQDAYAVQVCQTLVRLLAGATAKLVACQEVLPSLYRLVVQGPDSQAQVYRMLVDAEGAPVKGLKALATYAEAQRLAPEMLSAYSVSELLLATEAAPPGFLALEVGLSLGGETPMFQTTPFRLVLLTFGAVLDVEATPNVPDGGRVPPPGGKPGGAAPPTLHRATFEKDAQGWCWKIERRDSFTHAWRELGTLRP